MFRSYGKAAVLAAVASACGYAGAATISIANNSANVSSEGAAAAAAGTTLTFDVDLNMGAFQSRDSVIRLSLGGISSARFATYNASTPRVTCKSADGSATALELDVTQNAASSATWDFGITGTSGTTSSASCTFTSLAVLARTLSAGTLTVQSAVKRVSDSDFTYDTASAKAVSTVSSQITSISVLSALNGVVDYTDQQGLGFDDSGADTAPGSAAGYGDALVVRVGSRDGMTLSTASSLTFTLTIEAESGKTFAWLDNDGDGVLNNSTSTGRITAGDKVTMDVAQNTITFVSNAKFTGTDRDFTVSFAHNSATPSTGVAISPMTFAAGSATVSGLTNSALTLGSWTSNGTTAKIPYMPINTTAGSSKIDPIIVLTNRSTVTGTVTVSIVNARGDACSGTLGTIDGGQTKSFGGSPLRSVLSACADYDMAAGEALNISLTATLPASTTELFTGYNAESGRVTVVNSLNGK